MTNNTNTNTNNGLDNTDETVFGAGGIGKEQGYPSEADYFAHNRHELHVSMPATTGSPNNNQSPAAANPQTTTDSANVANQDTRDTSSSTQSLPTQVPGGKTVMRAWLDCRDDELVYRLSSGGN